MFILEKFRLRILVDIMIAVDLIFIRYHLSRFCCERLKCLLLVLIRLKSVSKPVDIYVLVSNNFQSILFGAITRIRIPSRLFG